MGVLSCCVSSLIPFTQPYLRVLSCPRKRTTFSETGSWCRSCFTPTCYLSQPLISSPALFPCLPSGCSSFIFGWRGSCHLGQKYLGRFSLRSGETFPGKDQAGAVWPCMFHVVISVPSGPGACSKPCLSDLGKHSAHPQTSPEPHLILLLSTFLPCPHPCWSYGNSCHSPTSTWQALGGHAQIMVWCAFSNTGAGMHWGS